MPRRNSDQSLTCLPAAADFYFVTLRQMRRPDMLKPVIAAAVLAIAGSTFVYAQQRSGESDFDGASRFAEHMRPSVGDVRAFADARIAALKAGLQLTPEQEKNWAPFEQALRDLVK